MSVWGPEFLKLALAHFLALISPGPEFAMVLRQSLHHGRRAAMLTAVGIGCAICLHVTYSLLGIGLLVRSSALAFTLLKFAGAAYLAWLGVHSLRAARAKSSAGVSPAILETAGGDACATLSRSAWGAGFLTNALNPKATFFFVAIFSTLVSPRTPRLIQAGYGVWIALTTMGWFTFVAVVLAHERVRRSFLRHRRWIDLALGALFLLFAASLVLTSLH